MTTTELYGRYGKPEEAPVSRVDGKAPEPHAPPHAIYPMTQSLPASKTFDPEIVISDYGTSFVASQTPSPTLYTLPLYRPPEGFFGDPITPAADIWTLGVSLYEVLGDRSLFGAWSCDKGDVIGEMVNTLGVLPARWWDTWANDGESFEWNGERLSDYRRTGTPPFRRLHQRLWDMGRDETPETCEWNIAGGELQALENFLRGMIAFEPIDRLTAEQLMASEYMIKWALPAWERQMRRKEGLKIR
ncbi:hypothetical protein DL771_001184 [Monosporascus sp. 5C6A]|nr:hypothetical protein DL771_001184 [Monosporascus sp. 5C6A]